MIRECEICGCEYDDKSRRGKPGKIIHCNDCAEEDIERYSGNMIYDHKTGASIQVNRDPNITKYINEATKLRNKSSNLGNNLKVPRPKQTPGAVLSVVNGSNAKGRS